MNGELPATDVGGFNPFAVLTPIAFGRGPGRLPTHPVTGEVGRLFPIANAGQAYSKRALRGACLIWKGIAAGGRIRTTARRGAAHLQRDGAADFAV